MWWCLGRGGVSRCRTAGRLTTLVVALSCVVGVTGSRADATPSNVSPPTISGTAQQGQTLTETNGVWTNTPTTFSYRSPATGCRRP
jgi:hypothetical protein